MNHQRRDLDQDIAAPNSAIPDTAIIGVDIDGMAAWWDGKDFAGNASVVESAQIACLLGRDIQVGFRRIIARDDTPDGAAAALSAYQPGRTRLDAAPDGLGEWLFEH